MALSETFLNALYAAPATPAIWGDVLGSCMAMVGADSGWVCELDRRDRFAGSGATRNMEVSTQDRYFAHFAGLDPFRHDAAGAPDPGLGLWSDERFIAKSDLVRSEFYADFMTPISVHSILIVRMYDDSHVTRSMHLNYSKGTHWEASEGWCDLQLAFSHLRRAAALSREVARLSNRGAALSSALEASAEYVILLDRRGRIGFATEAAEAVLRRADCLVVKHQRLGAAHQKDEVALQRLLTAAIDGIRRCRTGGSMQLTVAGRDLPVVATVTPIGHDTSGFDEPVAIVSLRDPLPSIPVSDRVLTTRFGLTPSERRIALMLATGSSPRQIAGSLALSYNTVRNHLKKIYEKVGVRRQSDLVAGLLRLGLASTRDDAAPY